MTHFTPPTYKDAYPDHDGSRVSCDRCSREVWPFVLQDMRLISGVAEDWLCDGCLSHMKRHYISVSGAPAPLTRVEWKHDLLKAHGAPPNILAKVLVMRETGFDRDKRKKHNAS